MPLLDIFRAVRDHTRDQRNAYRANTEKLPWRIGDVFARTWDLGFTAFGGPPVHFQILHHRFVEGRGGKAPWIDEQTYQELFAICQALPGPGSTKMAFCIALIHAGILPALFVFLVWSLPGAIGMYGLSLGVQRMNEVLPRIVYALLSGLNASTVGIIALAAVQLADKAIKDKITRILVILGACAGLCYNALWYFPILMLIGGLATVIWDGWLRQRIGKLRTNLQRRKAHPQREAEESAPIESVALEEQQEPSNSEAVQRRAATSSSKGRISTELSEANITRDNQKGDLNTAPVNSEDIAPAADTSAHAIPVKWGICIIVVFLATFIAVLVTRGILHHPPLALELFANMYLAGTIIFGGGPVVIPLLREYVVQPGWVSPRDFLIGLAIIQAFPGPNFNFGVYLGALALIPSTYPTVFGAFLGYVGIFVPGITLAVGVQSIWRVLRTKPSVISLLRGINATAVGLVFTAVYRLWQIGYLTPDNTQGQSLAMEPWWVVVAALTYAESAWFNVPPAAAIVMGAVLGLCWYGAVGK
ncbi:chromate ion transporter [Lepidopterella palustris CBS 459.81]|uniref:Chromate ion transporter n=1 Tax=Lepidopterella palustris CBS 459.81 TaxID=1314670 RepID=A0A8E2ED88_9PEZI|nr:chromate ion transporter [Lepidopterella palustris CBS 459.81]